MPSKQQVHVMALSTLLLFPALCVSGCDWKTHASISVVVDEKKRPAANSAYENLVEANGAQQGDGVFIEHDCILGEPFMTGTIGVALSQENRHGFYPPLIPGWPYGIARLASPPSGDRN